MRPAICFGLSLTIKDLCSKRTKGADAAQGLKCEET